MAGLWRPVHPMGGLRKNRIAGGQGAVLGFAVIHGAGDLFLVQFADQGHELVQAVIDAQGVGPVLRSLPAPRMPSVVLVLTEVDAELGLVVLVGTLQEVALESVLLLRPSELPKNWAPTWTGPGPCR